MKPKHYIPHIFRPEDLQNWKGHFICRDEVRMTRLLDYFNAKVGNPYENYSVGFISEVGDEILCVSRQNSIPPFGAWISFRDSVKPEPENMKHFCEWLKKEGFTKRAKI